MKNKWILISSIIQLLIGLLTIGAFIILYINGEDMTRWIVTLILAIAFMAIGIINILDYKNNNDL